MPQRILWAVVAGFLSGVLVRSFFSIGLWSVAFLIFLGVVIGLFAFFEPHRNRVRILLSLSCIFFALGIARMDSAVLVGDPTLTHAVGQKVILVGRIVAEPDIRESGTRVSILVSQLQVGSTTTGVHAKVLAAVSAYTEVSYGDMVTVAGELRLPQAFDTGEGRQFHYPEFLAGQGIGYELAFAHVNERTPGAGNLFLRTAIEIKQMYLRGEAAVLPEPEAGLAGGITVGDKRSIGSELSKEFQRVSLVHMLVLSGYNITVVINAIARMLAWMPRLFRFGVSGSFVLFFILMSGGAASAMRAGIMALIAMYARVSGRSFMASRALAVVALGMVAWNPFTLAFDPSFQLSTLATVGLIFFTPYFASKISWVSERFGMREILASTLATQCAVLPLLLYQNGQFSLVSLPANVLALIPVPFAMLASFIAAIAGTVFGALAVPIALPAYILLRYILAVAHFFASLPFASVSVPAFSVWWMFAAYVVMLVWILKSVSVGSEASDRL